MDADGDIQQAFSAFATESQIPGATPFGDPGHLGYADSFDTFGFFGNHPVMDFTDPGSTLSIQEVESAFSEPLVPSIP